MNTTTRISKYDDVIDSRDIIERIEELRAELEDEHDDEQEAELCILLALQDEAEGSPDWNYGEALIRDSYFQTYAQELAEDCYDLPDTWPHRCIDWEQAAHELKADYFSVDFDGVDYWIRN